MSGCGVAVALCPDTQRLHRRICPRTMPVPYIVNFSMVDGDGDGTISADEFKAGCAKGMVKSTQP